MKEDLNALRVFARVAQLGTFTAAAKALAMPKATVSAMVSALEQRLGTRLLERTTRRVGLTEPGRAYLASCERILAEVDAGRRAVEELQGAPRGLLRVSVPFTLARSVLAPLLPGFRQRYPDLRVRLDINSRAADPLSTGNDVALRIGATTVKAAQVQRVTVFATRLYASREYVAVHGVPLHASQLSQHELLGHTDINGRLHWRLHRGPETVEVEAEPVFGVSDPDTRSVLVHRGCGIAWMPCFLSADAVARGDLVECLPDWDAQPVQLNAVLPSAGGSSPKVLAFIEHLQSAIGPTA